MSLTNVDSFIKGKLGDAVDELYSGKSFSALRSNMHKELMPQFNTNSHHINGYYYLNMVSGPWLEHAISLLGTTPDILGFPISSKIPYINVANKFGSMCKQISYTAPIIEYDQITGKSKNLVQVSKESIVTDFSLTINDTFEMDFLFYVTLWQKYIIALKKGYIENKFKTTGDAFQEFYNVPYHNAVHIIQMNANFGIKGITKIMGVTPTFSPIPEYLGVRGEASHKEITYTFKMIDMYQNLIYSEDDIEQSELMYEFSKSL